MTLRRMVNDSVHWYMQDLTSRVVAESGTPTDRHHLGKIILQSLKDAPDFVLQGYYNNIEATKETFTTDGWLKTGDLFYRDENWNFFHVDRLKLQLKCLNVRLSPLEIEEVIRKHPDVLDVAFTSVPHTEWGDLPVACVVPRPGAKPSAGEIKNLVKDSLQDAKRLRGGVIFIDSMPMTATTKVHQRKLKEMALVLPRA